MDSVCGLVVEADLLHTLRVSDCVSLLIELFTWGIVDVENEALGKRWELEEGDVILRVVPALFGTLPTVEFVDRNTKGLYLVSFLLLLEAPQSLDSSSELSSLAPSTFGRKCSVNDELELSSSSSSCSIIWSRVWETEENRMSFVRLCPPYIKQNLFA